MDQTQSNSKDQSGADDEAYVFWLHAWKAQPGGAVDKARLARCTIDRERIRTDAALHADGAPLDIPISTVIECDKTSNFRVPVNTVAVRTRKGQTLLTPTNPFDPSLVYHTNLDEADALADVINGLRDRQPLRLDTNPYLRQMLKKDRPRSVANLEVEWDANVSPLTYAEQYRGQAARMAPVLSRMVNLISIAVVIAVLLLFVWWYWLR